MYRVVAHRGQEVVERVVLALLVHGAHDEVELGAYHDSSRWSKTASAERCD